MLSIQHVSDRAGGDQIAGVQVPQAFAGFGVQHGDIAELSRREQKAAGGGKQPLSTQDLAVDFKCEVDPSSQKGI